MKLCNTAGHVYSSVFIFSRLNFLQLEESNNVPYLHLFRYISAL